MSTVCKTCGGPVNRVGNYYVCEYCRNKWEIDSGNDIHAVDRANAWSALRDGDFEKAAELFENIIVKEAKNHEAYWGRALALAGIVYVTDMNENKKVPTCNNITEESFINNKDVKKAISLAPADIADGYKQQAEYIEKVRVEWLEKASKEPEYDVFISFKDSDRENGIERTQDSIDAQDLYNALVAEGYKVFFSRISLRDKIAEQYEPYIYNAIKTAKVMIVFGEKAEYFSSVWIKNEWSRFKTRIEKGEKHKNSLVVVYKNMNPGDLPVVLKSRQCLNAGDMTFLSDLTRHIKRVVEESKKNVHLDKIEIAGGQIAKKATALTVNSVQTREIGEGAIAETSISEKQSIGLIYTYLGERQWQEASTLVEDVLFNNPGCAEAIWCKLLVTYKTANNGAVVKKLNTFKSNDYRNIEKILNCASKEFAEEILSLLYNSENEVSDETYVKILNTILPYSFSKRKSKIKAAFEGVIERGKFGSFALLLKTLESKEIDRYIEYNYRFSKKTTSTEEVIECLKNILEVDEGNIDARYELIKSELSRLSPNLDFDTEGTEYNNRYSEIKVYGLSSKEKDLFSGVDTKTIYLQDVDKICICKALENPCAFSFNRFSNTVILNEIGNIMATNLGMDKVDKNTVHLASTWGKSLFYRGGKYTIVVNDPCCPPMVKTFEIISDAPDKGLRHYTKITTESIIENFKKLLSYSSNIDFEIERILDYMAKDLWMKEHFQLAKEFIRYYSKDVSNLKDKLLNLSQRMIYCGLFKEAEYFVNLCISFDPMNPEAYWLICLLKTHAYNEDDIINSSRLIKDVPEFNKHLTLVDANRQKTCISLSKKQAQQNIKNKIQSLEDEANSLVIVRTTPDSSKTNSVFTLICFGLALFVMFTLGFKIGFFWSVILGIVAFFVAVFVLSGIEELFLKTPSRSVVDENIKKKKALLEEIERLKENLK